VVAGAISRTSLSDATARIVAGVDARQRLDRASEARAQHQCALERLREVLLRAVDPRRECESVGGVSGGVAPEPADRAIHR
jgi:hypothetical protein